MKIEKKINTKAKVKLIRTQKHGARMLAKRAAPIKGMK